MSVKEWEVNYLKLKQLPSPTMTSKDCGNHRHKHHKLRRCFAGLLIFFFIVLLVVLLVWAILQPKDPRFVLQDATIYALNVSTPNILTVNIQITLAYLIPPTYQGHKEIITWSPFLSGTAVPVAPYNAIALNQDQSYGALTLIIKIDGRVKWKVGSFTSGRYHLNVKCVAPITFGARSSGVVIGNAVKYQMASTCSVSV
ncbi:unnamed protein product, partial [Vitis vinifera]